MERKQYDSVSDMVKDTHSAEFAAQFEKDLSTKVSLNFIIGEFASRLDKFVNNTSISLRDVANDLIGIGSYFDEYLSQNPNVQEVIKNMAMIVHSTQSPEERESAIDTIKMALPHTTEKIRESFVPPLSQHEAAYLVGFLEHLGWVFGNNSCNEMYLPDTEENRKLVSDATGRPILPRRHNAGKEIIASDLTILNYLKSKLIKSYHLEGKVIPEIG